MIDLVHCWMDSLIAVLMVNMHTLCLVTCDFVMLLYKCYAILLIV